MAAFVVPQKSKVSLSLLLFWKSKFCLVELKERERGELFILGTIATRVRQLYTNMNRISYSINRRNIEDLFKRGRQDTFSMF